MAEQRLMKDGLGPDAVERVAQGLSAAEPGFPIDQFRRMALAGLEKLELKERVHHLIAVMAECLPDDFERCARVLANIPDVFDRGDPDDNLRGFAAWPIIDFVGVHGRAHPEVALPLLRRLTAMFSAEFAIRPFLKDRPNETLETISVWVDDPDEHVRRLVSEGTRPRLPWGERLQGFVEDPTPLIPLLESLRDDPSEYVRRSVANNLNDIAKDHPDLIVELAKGWLVDAPAERAKLIKHSLRTLIKDGNAGAFEALGYPTNPLATVSGLGVRKRRIHLGETLEFQFAIEGGTTAENLILDYAIHFVKSDGRRSPKVFKLRTLEIDAGQSVEVKKRHPLKPITTRRYYQGEHVLAIHVNGSEVARTSFELEV